jgi:hypothetical protein
VKIIIREPRGQRSMAAEMALDGRGVRNQSGLGTENSLHRTAVRRGPNSNRCTRLCRPLPNPLGHRALRDVPWYPGRGTTFGMATLFDQQYISLEEVKNDVAQRHELGLTSGSLKPGRSY